MRGFLAAGLWRQVSEVVNLAGRPEHAATLARLRAAHLDHARRIGDLGFLPETPVRALRRAPLGDPTVYELRGYRVCLRREDAVCVRVQRAESEAP